MFTLDHAVVFPDLCDGLASKWCFYGEFKVYLLWIKIKNDSEY